MGATQTLSNGKSKGFQLSTSLHCLQRCARTDRAGWPKLWKTVAREQKLECSRDARSNTVRRSGSAVLHLHSADVADVLRPHPPPKLISKLPHTHDHRRRLSHPNLVQSLHSWHRDCEQIRNLELPRKLTVRIDGMAL